MYQLHTEKQQNYFKEVIHLTYHSDRGCQYASRGYVVPLKSCRIRISITKSDDPKGNAQS